MTTPRTRVQPPFTIRGWHVGCGVAAFFALVIGVDAAFLTLAYRTHPGQVEARPYETGLIHNAELRRLRAQQAMGWRAAVEARPDGLVVLMQDRDGAPLGGLAVTVVLQRPATERGRSDLSLTETAPGRYVVERPGLSGAWDVQIEARSGVNPSFMADRRLTWP